MKSSPVHYNTFVGEGKEFCKEDDGRFCGIIGCMHSGMICCFIVDKRSKMLPFVLSIDEHLQDRQKDACLAF